MANASYEYEPSPEGVLEVLLPKYAETLIYSAVLEGKASEFGARMTAMGSATKNATKMISSVDAWHTTVHVKLRLRKKFRKSLLARTAQA